MKIINFALLLLIFITTYLFLQRSYLKRKLQEYSANNYSNSTKDFKFKTFISKINFLKTKDLFLSKQGNPLKLDVIRYYLLKIGLFLLFFIAGSINYNQKLIPIILGLIGFFFIDIYILLNKKFRDTQICNDLLNVVNSICLQLSAHMSLKDSIKYQFENCQNLDFKKAMMEFSTCYELSELNIDKAIKVLNNHFEILEIDLFCNALSEYNQTGSIIKILENLSETLNQKQIEKMQETTRSKVIYITLGVIIALVNIILLVFYPLFISLSDGFNNIFK